MPDQYELHSIVDFGMDPEINEPNVDEDVFPNTEMQEYWTSASRGFDVSCAWIVNFSDGYMDWRNKGGWSHIRCVRGGPTPRPPRFQRDTSNPENPIVVDNLTGFTWQGCVRGFLWEQCIGYIEESGWQSALSYCEGLTWDGYSDWRLPSVIELRSILDYRIPTWPLADEELFPSTPVDDLWSSTTRGIQPSSAQAVHFGTGKDESKPKNYIYYEYPPKYTRCIRGGSWN
jgi:hypothetical protein